MKRIEFEPKLSEFNLSWLVLRRILLWSSLILPFSIAAFYFELSVIGWFSLFLVAGIVIWQVTVYGFMGREIAIVELELDAVETYGKPYLVIVAIFWAALVIGSAVALYLKAQS